ncbi:MAG TPA: BatD family protein [Flavisolibacter sp.]|nr:BatD family protein [Flavisolibacter sp.]
MKGKLIILLLLPVWCFAQNVQLIVPGQPVIVGSAFQVQYIVTNPSELLEASQPSFDSCLVISGPNVYRGDAMIEGKMQPIENITYTLQPKTTGVLRIGAITVMYKGGGQVVSSNGGVTSVPPPRASFSTSSSYTDVNLYAPPKAVDRQQLVDENLFIKTTVDKRSCYEGEPIVATFTLYSRLQSTSEAEKSPSFYGFSVVDVLDINQAHMGVEKMNGKVFNTSILRKVQLYPVQAGKLTIDQLYVDNDVEFVDSLTGGRTTVDKELITEPITITVKPLPATRPASFTGAVGNYTIAARLDHPQLQQHAQGKLLITIRGKGNFIQFSQPVVHWPHGIEPFEPVITDQVKKEMIPIEGLRQYEFGFAVDSSGHYTLPPINFSYFDPAKESFVEVQTDSLSLMVTPRTIRSYVSQLGKRSSSPYIWIPVVLLFLASSAFLWYRWKTGRQNKQAITIAPEKLYLQQLDQLEAAALSGKEKLIELQKILSGFLNENKELSPGNKKEVQSLLHACQAAIYSSGDDEMESHPWIAKARELGR